MLIWAVVNPVLSLLALAFALLNKGAPHRLRFHVCFIALLCWLVPWAQVPGWLPDLLSLDLWRVEQRLITQTAAATQIPLIYVDTRTVPLANDFTVLHLPLLALCALLLTGLVLFAWNLLRHQLRLQLLKRSARDGSAYWNRCGIESSVPILLQRDISGAFSSGVFKPVIWVHDDLAASAELPTLLRHELTHIEQHDNWYLLAITLVEKLFWWNPLVWYLSKQARELQELSCDERCRANNADYPAELAALMLSNLGVSRSTTAEPLLLSANIFNKTNLDIQRLKVLQRSHQMKPRHIVSAATTAMLAVAAVGLVTAQPDPGVAGDTQHVFMGVKAADGGPNQFVRMERNDSSSKLTFYFTDAPLPLVLAPVARMLVDPAQLAAAMEAGEATDAFTLHKPDANDTGSPQEQVFIRDLTLEQKLKLDKFNAEHPQDGVKMKTLRLGGKPTTFDVLLSSKLVLEDASAKTRLVTVSFKNLTVEEAIAKIAEASECNIFKDKDTIVVDYCKPQ